MNNNYESFNDADKTAAHQFLAELRTRIATQPLPYQHGVEERALESLWELFGHARDAIKKNTGCNRFAAMVVQLLNGEIRPVTAKWHRAKEEGRLWSRDGADAFRADLKSLQIRLRAFSADLQEQIYGERREDTITPPVFSEDQLDTLFSSLPYKLHVDSIGGPAISAEIEKAEIQSIVARRNGGTPTSPQPGPVPNDVVGLALSGGGIRSATFCLGVTQVLAERDLLRDVDVLSTVSGGGYTGAFVSDVLGRGGGQADLANPYGPDTQSIRKLRLNAKFLAVDNLKEGWIRVVAAGAGLLLNWSAVLFLIALTALLLRIGACMDGGSISSINFLSLNISCESIDSPSRLYLLLKTFVGLSVLLLLAYAVAIRSSERSSHWVGAALGFAAAVTSVLTLLWIAKRMYPELVALPSSAGLAIPIATAMPIVGTMVLRFLPLIKSPAVREKLLKVLLYLAGVLIPLTLIAGIYVCFWLSGFEQLESLGGISGFTLLAMIAVAAGAVSVLLLNINATSPHRLYRDGLARTFVSQDLEKKPIIKSNPTKKGPYHLINTAVNLPSSQALVLRDRKTDFFLISKHFCGSPSTGYCPTGEWKLGRTDDIDVASAIAISGAAVSPHMGLGAMPSLTALMSFLNVRLGFWILHPQRGGLLKVPGFLCLLREMTGISMSEKNAWLNLSDGGHIENLAAYELLRRRCKFIISVDGEADPGFMFQGLMTLVRHAQIDLGVRIDARLDELRVDEKVGFSKRHAMLWRVLYPDGSVGLMLYLKLSVTGNESELIKRYRALHPTFPHQTTLDQFFDEEQFEAYRQLGVHVADGLFHSAVTNGCVTPSSVQQWFRALSRNLLEP